MPVLAFSRSLVSGSREVPFARRCVGRIVDFGEGMNRWFARWYSREAFELGCRGIFALLPFGLPTSISTTVEGESVVELPTFVLLLRLLRLVVVP